MEQNNREAARSVFISLTATEVIWGYVDSTLKLCQKILARRLMEIEVTEP